MKEKDETLESTDTGYYQRPEMWRMMLEQKWRDYAWDMAQAIEKIPSKKPAFNLSFSVYLVINIQNEMTRIFAHC
jgi:hypothetical protein